MVSLLVTTHGISKQQSAAGSRHRYSSKIIVLDSVFNHGIIGCLKRPQIYIVNDFVHPEALSPKAYSNVRKDPGLGALIRFAIDPT